jgi:hypothetical protein
MARISFTKTEMLVLATRIDDLVKLERDVEPLKSIQRKLDEHMQCTHTPACRCRHCLAYDESSQL